MNTQTAAALRALIAKWRHGNETELSSEYFYRQKLADELAAVLTQEGADVDETPIIGQRATCKHCNTPIERFFDKGPADGWRHFDSTGKYWAHCDRTGPLNDERMAAPAEPRAAEGAGTVAELTAVIAHDNGAAEADAAIASINRGDTVIQHNASEMFFHQLRYRVAKDPALCERIKVLYRDPSGKLVPIGLRFEDEMSWPSGFLQGSWEKEREIQLLRKPAEAAAVPAGGDAGPKARHWKKAYTEGRYRGWNVLEFEEHARALAAKEAK